MTDTPKVLILDDDLIIAFELAKLLKENNFEVVGPFGNTQDAIDSIEKAEHDAAFLDINMGDGTDSLELADMLMKKELPFAFFTAYGSADILPPRFDSITTLSKPARPADIMAEISTQVSAR